MGINLGTIDKIVLSHGHYDHTGGLPHILRKMRKEAEIIAHPDIWTAKYARRQGERDRYIGIPFQRYELESLGARFNLTSEPVRITDAITTTGEIPMATDFEDIDDALFVRTETGWHPDKLMDDQALIISTRRGLIVILGCAHRGMINTLYHARQLTGVETIHTVVGGAHLVNASEERMYKTIVALRDLDVQRLALCHCTGLPAACLMAQEFGEKFYFNSVGTSIEFT
jgi:7,8-dihydropterin-6-yl-methyl-4-(beta-D-ribofuranosyl)aminobenzene 5'-phosphate synthase